jgi:hypothetical protein
MRPPGLFLSELIWSNGFYKQFVGLLGWGTGPSQGRYLHRTTQTQKKRTQSFMPRVGFEPTNPVSRGHRDWLKNILLICILKLPGKKINFDLLRAKAEENV